MQRWFGERSSLFPLEQIYIYKNKLDTFQKEVYKLTNTSLDIVVSLLVGMFKQRIKVMQSGIIPT